MDVLFQPGWLANGRAVQQGETSEVPDGNITTVGTSPVRGTNFERIGETHDAGFCPIHDEFQSSCFTEVKYSVLLLERHASVTRECRRGFPVFLT